MKRLVFLPIIFEVFMCSLVHTTELTYSFSGGRFGDNLIAYIHAKWLSYKYWVRLLYKPFIYSDQLVLHKHEIQFSEAKHYDQIIELTNNTVINAEQEKNWLYIVPYYPECVAEFTQFKNTYNFHCSVDWNDPIFLSHIRYLISPVEKLSPLCLPHDRLCVAVHVRKGGGYDAQPFLDGGPLKNEKGTPADIAFPLKFPPDNFYIEQLRNVSVFFNHTPMYVYIFTDDQNPERLANKYAQALDLSNIIFDYRKVDNAYNANVLEDFFSMMQFDVLIRSESSYSLVASRLAKRQLVIYPLAANYLSNAEWNNGPLKILQYAVIKTKG